MWTLVLVQKDSLARMKKLNAPKLVMYIVKQQQSANFCSLYVGESHPLLVCYSSLKSWQEKKEITLR